MVIYLSGIDHDTHPKEIERHKHQLFNLGCTIVSPEEKTLNKLSWSENVRWRLSSIQKSNAIYMLPNWRDSIIARIELTAAMSNKLPVCFSPQDLKNLLTSLDD
jgi:hypothetical protein